MQNPLNMRIIYIRFDRTGSEDKTAVVFGKFDQPFARRNWIDYIEKVIQHHEIKNGMIKKTGQTSWGFLGTIEDLKILHSLLMLRG